MRLPLFAKGTFYANRDIVENKLNPYLLKKIKAYLYEGLFSETEKLLRENLLKRKVAVVNIDCDIESSTSDALRIVEDYLQIGSIIMLDDYNAFCANNNLGQRRAFSKFREKSQFQFEKFFTYQYSGQTFLVTGINKGINL